jgi:hypothetical protein
MILIRPSRCSGGTLIDACFSTFIISGAALLRYVSRYGNQAKLPVKRIGFLSFGHWTPSPQSATRSAADALLQSIDLAVAAEELGADEPISAFIIWPANSPRPSRCSRR